MKTHDKELCMNALHVLPNSPGALEKLMSNFGISKEQVLVFAQELILELFSTFKYPSMNTFVKYRQITKAKQLALKAVSLKQKRR